MQDFLLKCPNRTFVMRSTSIQRFVLNLIFISIGVQSCLPFHAYVYHIPDQKDIKRFKHAEVKHANESFEFHKTKTNHPIHVYNWSHKTPLSFVPLEEFLQKQKCHHFLVIKNDSIVFEYHNPKIETYQPSPVFSISKTMVSASLGVAISKGYIESTNELVKKYIPELNHDKRFDLLTINHLLNHESGIKETVNNLARANYGRIEKILPKIEFVRTPGEYIEYVNTNYTLLGIVLERATKQDLYAFFSENIWSKIGTTDSTVWGYDYQTNHTRAMSFIGASPQDLAKFGRLYIHKGVWNGESLIDSNWINKTTSTVNASGKTMGYNSGFFIGEKEMGDYLALGMYRQQLYMNPKSNVIIVGIFKFNNQNLPLKWWEILRQISRQASMPMPENN